VAAAAGCSVRGSGLAHDTARADVRAVLDRFYETARVRRWADLSALLADDFEIYTDGATRYGKREYLALLQADDLETLEMALEDVEVRVSADETMAWAKFRGRFRLSLHGRRQDVRTAETLVFTKARGGWAITRAHASVAETKD
jgi:ketosteroid isomerase-like protein